MLALLYILLSIRLAQGRVGGTSDAVLFHETLPRLVGSARVQLERAAFVACQGPLLAGCYEEIRAIEGLAAGERGRRLRQDTARNETEQLLAS